MTSLIDTPSLIDYCLPRIIEVIVSNRSIILVNSASQLPTPHNENYKSRE